MILPTRLGARIKRVAHLLGSQPTTFLDRLSAHMTWWRWLILKRPVRRRLGDVLFEFDFSLSRYVKNMNFGWYQEEVVEALRRFLKPGDVFLDVGANIGYLSALAAGLVGPGGQVHCFEPAPPYFKWLQRLVQMNPRYPIAAHSFALGEHEGRARLMLHQENMLLNAICPDNHDSETAIDVPIRRLDAYLEEHISKPIALIKIDVEGFEFPVLKGLHRYFDTTPSRPVIICEIFSCVYTPDGLEELVAFLRKYGYTQAYDVKDFEHPVDIRRGWRGGDVVFIADALEKPPSPVSAEHGSASASLALNRRVEGDCNS